MTAPTGSRRGARHPPVWTVFLLCGLLSVARAATVELAPADTPAGYVARLLVNETPFPGESFWVSEEDTSAAQAAIIWVLRHRLNNIPLGYTQRQVAAVTSRDVIDLMTAGGEHGQVEGFYRDGSGRPVMSCSQPD